MRFISLCFDEFALGMSSGTKLCFVIGRFMAEGGTTVVVLSDWTIPLSVNFYTRLLDRLMERTRER